MATTLTIADVGNNSLAWLRPSCVHLYSSQIMPTATRIKKRGGVLRFSVNHAWPVKEKYPNAQFLEFGVYQGKDVALIASFITEKEKRKYEGKQKTVIHGFDSFEGLPEEWNNGQRADDGSLLFQAGAFDLGGVPPVVAAPNVELHRGWFEDTVPKFLDHHTAPIAFCHADADLYGSTMTFLEEICCRKLLVVGSVITFDEFSNYENWEEGEFLAWNEIVAKYGLEYQFLCYHGPSDPTKLNTYGYQSVGVVITGVSAE
jgi:hypothetical protein